MAPTTRIVCRVAAALGAPLLAISLTAAPAAAEGDLPGEAIVLGTDLDAPSVLDAESADMTGVDTNGLGQVVVADAANNVVFQPQENGSPALVWGTGTPREPSIEDEASWQLLEPQDVAVSEDGDVFVAEADGAVRTSTSNGEIEQLVAAGELTDDGTELALAAGEDGLYIGDGDGVITRVDYDNPESTEEFANLEEPIHGLTDARHGTIYAAVGHAVMRVTSSGHDEFGSIDLEQAIPEVAVGDATAVMDVEVGPNGLLVAVGLHGLLVFNSETVETLRPHLRGLSVAANHADIVVAGQAAVHQMSYTDIGALPPANTKGVAPAPEVGSVSLSDTAGTSDSGMVSQVTSLSQEAAGLAVSPSGRIVIPTDEGVLDTGSEGTVSVRAEHETDPDTAADAFVTDDDRLVLLSSGELSVTRSDGQRSLLPVGLPSRDINATAGLDRELSHMAASTDQLFMALGPYVYEVSDHGLLSRYPEASSQLPGVIRAMAADPDGELSIVHEDGDRMVVSQIAANPVGDSTTELFDDSDVSGGFAPTGVTVDDGIIYMTEHRQDRVLRHTGSGAPEVIAGGWEAGLEASSAPTEAVDTALSTPHSPLVDSTGTLLFINDDRQVLAIRDAGHGSGVGHAPSLVITIASLVALGIASGVLLHIRRRLGTP